MHEYSTFSDYEDYLLNEARITAEGWEAVIIYCWNKKHFAKKYTNDKGGKTLLKDSKIDRKYYYIVNEIWALKMGDKIVDNVSKDIPKTTFLVHTGTKKAPLSKWWELRGGTNATPKTDIMSSDGKHRISLKKDGPHQLLAASSDALPTLYTAFNKCIKFSTPEFKKRFDDFAQDFKENDINIWKQFDRNQLLNRFKSELGIEDKSELRELTKKDLTAKLKDLIKKVFTDNDQQKFVKSMFDVYRLDDKLQDIMNESLFFNTMFTGEAITGLVKFGNNEGTANDMMVFSPKDGRTRFKSVINSKNWIDGDGVQSLIKGHNVTIHVAFKIRDNKSSGGHGEYSRVVVNQQVDAGYFTDDFYEKEFESIALDSFNEVTDSLNEGLIDYIGILGKWIKRIIMKLIGKVWEWAQQGIEFLLDLAGLEISSIDCDNDIVFAI